MAISLTLTGLASVLVGISLTSCQTLRTADTNRPPLKPASTSAEIGSVTALAGISGEPEMRVRIAEGINTASFSTGASGATGGGGGGGAFWVVPVATVVRDLMNTCAEQIDRLGSATTLEPIERILNEGTSAHQQLKIYNDGRAAGDENPRALCKVIDWLKATTLDVASS